MSLAIAGKVVGGLVLGSASAVGIGYIIYDALQDKRLAFFVSSTDLTSDNTSATKLEEGETKNYKCKFDSKEEFDCTITAINFDADKKHSNISKFTTYNNNANLLTKTELQKKGNFYKVIVNDANAENQVDATKDEFEVVSKVNNETGKKFAKFKKLFAMNGKTINTEHTKTKYFVIQASEDATVTSSTTKCSFVGGSFKETCSYYTFGTADGKDLKTLEFAGTNATTSITQDNYYLIELTAETNDIQQSKMFVEINNAGKKISTNVMAAIKFEGTSDNKHLFILN